MTRPPIESLANELRALKGVNFVCVGLEGEVSHLGTQLYAQGILCKAGGTPADEACEHLRNNCPQFNIASESDLISVLGEGGASLYQDPNAPGGFGEDTPPPPLREIVERKPFYDDVRGYVAHEHLECGHVVEVDFRSLHGTRKARRCEQCNGDMPKKDVERTGRAIASDLILSAMAKSSFSSILESFDEDDRHAIESAVYNVARGLVK